MASVWWFVLPPEILELYSTGNACQGLFAALFFTA